MSQSLTFQSHSVRVHTEGEKLWFVAKDVCQALNITWTSHTLDTIPESWQGVVKLTTPRRGGRQSLVTINEAATYKLAFRSNKPEADAFTNWVASEVLPAIRKTGSFGQPKPEQASLPGPDPYLPSAQNRVDALTHEIGVRLSECLSLYVELEDIFTANLPRLSMQLGPARLALASSLRRGSISHLDSVRNGIEGLRHTCKALACYQA